MQLLDATGQPLEGYRYEDCRPFQGNCTAWTPTWRDGRQVAALKDRIVRLRVKLTNGRLYAIRGQFELKVAHEAELFTKQGIRTVRRIGS